MFSLSIINIEVDNLIQNVCHVDKITKHKPVEIVTFIFLYGWSKVIFDGILS